MESEVKILLQQLRARKKELSWHHPLDDNPNGSGTVREARANINYRIKHLKQQ